MFAHPLRVEEERNEIISDAYARATFAGNSNRMLDVVSRGKNDVRPFPLASFVNSFGKHARAHTRTRREGKLDGGEES